MRYRYEYFKHIDEMCSRYENILLEYFIYRYGKHHTFKNLSINFFFLTGINIYSTIYHHKVGVQ